MQFTFRAFILYEGEIEAEDTENAEIEVFERLADGVTKGEIRIDCFENNSDSGLRYRFPQLVGVDVFEKKPKKGSGEA